MPATRLHAGASVGLSRRHLCVLDAIAPPVAMRAVRCERFKSGSFGLFAMLDGRACRESGGRNGRTDEIGRAHGDEPPARWPCRDSMPTRTSSTPRPSEGRRARGGERIARIATQDERVSRATRLLRTDSAAQHSRVVISSDVSRAEGNMAPAPPGISGVILSCLLFWTGDSPARVHPVLDMFSTLFGVGALVTTKSMPGMIETHSAQDWRNRYIIVVSVCRHAQRPAPNSGKRRSPLRRDCTRRKMR